MTVLTFQWIRPFIITYYHSLLLAFDPEFPFSTININTIAFLLFASVFLHLRFLPFLFCFKVSLLISCILIRELSICLYGLMRNKCLILFFLSCLQYLLYFFKFSFVGLVKFLSINLEIFICFSVTQWLPSHP